MARASREFQVFAKPAGSLCNLECHYCYYLKKEDLYSQGESFRMPDSIWRNTLSSILLLPPVR